MSYATEQGVLNAQWNAAQEAQITEQARRAPHVLMRPRIFPDGNAWCALYGENIQEGVVGFGETPEAAAADFDLAWRKQKNKVAASDAFDRKDVEAVADRLGDDATQLRNENHEDERADNMDRAASMLTWMLLTHPAYVVACQHSTETSMNNETVKVRVATPDEPLPHTALLEQALRAMAEVQERAEPGFEPDVAVIPAEDWRTFVDAHAEILLLWTAWRDSPYRDAPRYVRKPEADKRTSRGDDFAGDAWLDTETGETVYTVVGFDRNASPTMIVENGKAVPTVGTQ